MRCGNCGEKEINFKNAKGREFPYKSFPAVPLRVDLDLMTCLKCGEIILRYGDCEKLDKAIEESIKMNKTEI